MQTIEIVETGNELVLAQEKVNTGLVAFNNKKSELEALAQSAAEITINGVGDKEGYKLADAKRKELKKERVSISSQGKEMRDTINKVSKDIIEKEKELIAIIEKEEKRLVEEQDKVDAEKERIRLEEIRKEEERIQKRVDGLRQYGYEIDLSALKSLSDEDYNQLQETAKANYEAEQARLEAERLEAEKKAEEERLAREAEAKKLADERKELEELRKKQEEAQKLIDEQNARIEEEALKVQQEKENVRTRLIASLGIPFNYVENAYIEQDINVRVSDIKSLNDTEWDALVNSVTERKIIIDQERKAMEAEIMEQAKKKAAADALQAEKDRKAAEEQERLRKEEEARIKAEQAPDRTKINEYIKSIKDLEVPVMKSANGKKIMASIQELVGKLTSYSTEKANTL
ncbi:hypothetical protein SAMN05192529_102102 [Arachidicoccus rhizosphaerae]|uniref:Uncharacterized protein n=1 Tax=Arachidicoccus rhizosphaerae TaxID=551991 RepID=A0A1H3W3C6_9BACT|nr:hypothetical protein [Arachidicoccus rhizosphaerae]SDZ81635.1 hypothetical protein SAMN05192529_102102 [Arachidicoccus rhizosphaerae]